MNGVSAAGSFPTGESLTHRELEVLELIADGLTSGAIAVHLCLSVETVKSHVAAIHKKLGAKSRPHAVGIGFRQGLLR